MTPPGRNKVRRPSLTVAVIRGLMATLPSVRVLIRQEDDDQTVRDLKAVERYILNTRRFAADRAASQALAAETAS